jgi:hypothetical protein
MARGENRQRRSAVPDASPGTVYVLWYPETTRITLKGATSCDTFIGYHLGWQLADGTPFSYVALPRCPRDAGGSAISELTIPASHEIVEACTDPRPDTQPAYQSTDPNHAAIAFALGTEVGDLCELGRSATFQPVGFPWNLQRIWSNSEAWLGNAPCVPAASPNCHYAAPLAADTMMTSVLTGSPAQVAAIHVPVGGTATVGIRLVANYAAGTLVVQAVDWNAVLGQPSRLTLTVSPQTGQPGDTLTLTITKQAGDPSGAEPFIMITKPSDPFTNEFTYFWGLTSD